MRKQPAAREAEREIKREVALLLLPEQPQRSSAASPSQFPVRPSGALGVC